MGFLGNNYVPPSVITRTLSESPLTTVSASLRIPVFMGTGNETLYLDAFETVRGSSQRIDQRVVLEDVAGRVVKNISLTGVVTLGSFDGAQSRVQVRNFPIVNGQGIGAVTNDRSVVSAFINGDPVVVISVDGAKGIVTLGTTPKEGDEVRLTYFFKRTDTQITENLSEQVTVDYALIDGEIGLGTGEEYTFVSGFNDTLTLNVDNTGEVTITLPEGSFSPSQVAAIINGENLGTLLVSAFLNSEGKTALRFRADRSLQIGSGTANGVIGISAGARTNRNRTFYTFQGPIVDGTNGGITTTDVTKVIVTVNNVVVVPTSVDGGNRAILLPFAPQPDATVVVTYYFNTWQNTFDYLRDPNVLEITRVGITDKRNDYFNGADFVLKDDKIVWGTATIVSSKTTTEGFTAFGPSQVSSTLVDNKEFLALCTAKINSSVNPPVQNRKDFLLPFIPTTGNGRNTPFSSEVYQKIANNKVDVPTNRPDLVTAYWGFSLQDALDRGPVQLVKVDGLTQTITFKDPVPVGASVWATFYYNNLEDNVYELKVVSPGSTGVGTYSISDKNGRTIYDAQFGTKSVGLTGITVQFPRGSEFFPDARLEANSSSDYTGPVDEVVTVTFAETQDTPAKYSTPGPGDYYITRNASDRARLLIDGTDLITGSAGVNVSNPTGTGAGYLASLLGEEVVYDSDTGGATYTITSTDSDITLSVDGVIVAANATTGAGATVQEYADAVNTAAKSSSSRPKYRGQARFASAFVVTASQYDRLSFHVTGDVTGTSGVQTITLTPGTYTSANALASQVNTQISSLPAPVAATGDFTLTSPSALDTVTINGVVLTGVSGARTSGSNDFDVRDSVQSTGTITVTGYPVTGTIVINGVTLTANAGARTSGSDDFDGTAGSANLVAADIAAAINDVANGFALIVSAVASTNTVTLTAATPGFVGAAGDAITLTETSPEVSVSGATLSGGLGPNNHAESLTDAINDPLNDVSDIVTAVQAANVVNLTAVVPGSVGNSITLASSNGVDLTPSAATLLTGVDGLTAGTVTCTADTSGRLQFTLFRTAFNGNAYLEFISDATPARDFATLAGIDTASAPSGTQTKLLDGDIAFVFTVGSAPLNHDRLVLRSRLLPGSGSISYHGALEQSQLRVGGAGKVELTGLKSQDYGLAGFGANIKAASLVGNVGWLSGQATGFGDSRDGQPLVVFYDGTGTVVQNNVFKFTVDNVNVTVVFTASSSGTSTPLGPVSVSGTVLNTIAAAMATAGFGSGVTNTVISLGLVRQEGAGIRITSPRTDQYSSVLVGTGNANSTLGFVEASSSSRTLVNARSLASALMAHAHASGDLEQYLLDIGSATSDYFLDQALAGIAKDLVGAEYLYVQSKTLGTTSSVSWGSATSNDILLPGTRLFAKAGEGAVGESGISGYFVTSNDTVNGSGSINTSVFNSGSGQDGFVGQTYRDRVTGLTFTILPREGSLNYPVNQTFTFTVKSVLTTNSNLPIRAISGTEVVVTNTFGTNAGDTAVVENFEKGGSEPNVGDLYYISYYYRKLDYRQRIFTSFSAIEAAYGPLSPNSSLTLASYLAIINGAAAIGLKQIPVDSTGSAPLSGFEEALVDLESDFQEGVSADVIIPLRGDKTEEPFMQKLALHADIMSSPRYQRERTIIFGLAPTVTPEEVGNLAQSIKNTRFRLIYPDSILINLTDNFGRTKEFLVEGFYLAAAVAGATVRPSTDVATPWTRRPISGIKALGRTLNQFEANVVAQNGVTIVSDDRGDIYIRHGLTTDMSDVLTKTPSITLIADEIQKRTRNTLNSLIGTKYLSSVLNEIQGRISTMYKGAMREQIITAFKGVSAQTDPDDITSATVESFYQPVFPLLYIYATFNLRSSGV